jgi:hypothetical protein
MKIMVLDRALTIQELLFNKPIEINKTAHFEAGGITADFKADVIPTNMDLDATQFYGNDTFFEKLGQHFDKNWGWYAGAIAIGIVAYHSLKSNGKEKVNKLNGFRSINGFIPFPDVPSQPIKIDTKPIVSIRSYIVESKSKQINTH